MNPSSIQKHPLTGKLEEHDLSDLLKQLTEEKAAGKLALQSRKTIKSIHFNKGNITFAESNLREDRLGEILVKTGRITPEQYKASVEKIKQTGQQQGAVLVQLGFLTARELFDGLKDQLQEILHSVYLWENGKFHFTPEEPSAHAVTVQIDLIELLSSILERLQTQPA